MSKTNPFDSFHGLQAIRQHLAGVLPTKSVDVTVTAAEVLALHTTGKTLVAAKTGAIHIPRLLYVFYDYNSAAYANIAAGDDLQVRWTDVSGAIGLTLETTGFLDQTADQRRIASDAMATAVAPVDGAALVLALGGAIDTGNSPLYARLFYSTIPTAFA